MSKILVTGGAGYIGSHTVHLLVEKGYDPSNVLTFQLVFPPEYPITRKTDTIEALLARLRATPAVESAGFTRAGILIPEALFVGTFVPQGQTVDEMRADPTRPHLRSVSHGYRSGYEADFGGRQIADIRSDS